MPSAMALKVAKLPESAEGHKRRDCPSRAQRCALLGVALDGAQNVQWLTAADFCGDSSVSRQCSRSRMRMASAMCKRGTAGREPGGFNCILELSERVVGRGTNFVLPSNDLSKLDVIAA